MARTERQRLVNFNTPTPANMPDIDDFEYGEIAVRYNTDNPELIIKRSDDSLLSLKPNSVKLYQSSSGSLTPGSATTCDVMDANVLSYFDGLSVMLKLGYAPDAEAGMNFQINSLGYKPVEYSDGTHVGDEWSGGDEIMLVYNATLEESSGAWQVVNTKQSDAAMVRTWANNVDYFYFEAIESGSSVGMLCNGFVASLEYSYDGTNWNVWNNTGYSGYASPVYYDVLPLDNVGDRLYFRGENLTFGMHDISAESSSFELKGKLKCGGDIRTLFDKVGKISVAYSHPSMRSHRDSTYQDADALTNIPDISHYRILESEAFYGFLSGCVGITSVPSDYLPWVDLAPGCYDDMFAGTRITQSPVLPAEVIPKRAYSNMFASCANLQEITCLATNITDTASTTNMTYGVSATGIFKKASSMNGWPVGVDGIPSGWVIENI